jgi:hypothetical protein
MAASGRLRVCRLPALVSTRDFIGAVEDVIVAPNYWANDKGSLRHFVLLKTKSFMATAGNVLSEFFN